jgi:hypothetical protein
MKRIFLLLTIIIGFTSCYQPVLKKNEYIIVDTLNISRNGFGSVLGYDVIIEFNGNLHYGWIEPDGTLTRVNIKPINLNR